MTDTMKALEAMLQQIYALADQGIEAPTAAYRWCERIDEVFHAGGAIGEYDEYTIKLPSATLATLRAALAPVADDDAPPERRGMPLPLRILAGVGALSFLLIGLNSLLLPQAAPPASPPPPPAGQAT